MSGTFTDLAVIERLYSELGEPDLADSAEQEALIVVAYRLHNLYSAFENIFRNIVTSFENHLDSSRQRQLLERMRLDLSPVRPAVFDGEAFEKLDELLRFRQPLPDRLWSQARWPAPAARRAQGPGADVWSSPALPLRGSRRAAVELGGTYFQAQARAAREEGLK